MVSVLVTNNNTYVSLADATSYLADSPRTTAWAFLDEDTQKRSVISATREFQKQIFLGTKGALNVVATATVNAGGSGYAVDDVLTVSTGTGVAATVKVLTLSTTAVATVQLTSAGLYSVDPTTTGVATTGGGGTSCTLDLTLETQPLAFPRTGLTDKDGTAVSSTAVPQTVKDALIEQAYLISQDTATEGSTGTADNNKVLSAGAVKIERFRPTAGTRFAAVVQELLSPFLQGLSNLTVPYISGVKDSDGVLITSSFDDVDRYGLSDGFA